VKELMDELGFLYTYTPVYSPLYNGIEEVFSQAKKLIKQQRLENLLNGWEASMPELIQEAFEKLDI